MDIKASDVMKLRQMTQAGMMDCKKALIEADGDFDRAKEILREKGKVVAAKRSDRETTEGAVLARTNGEKNKAVMVCLGCETDFVAKTDGFQALANGIADAAMAEYPADLDSLKKCKLGDITVDDAIMDQTGKSGEKHVIACYEKVEAPYVGFYVHSNKKVATIVGFNKQIADDAVKEIAMQITAMAPIAVTADEIPQARKDEEFSLAVNKTKEELVKKAVDAALSKAGLNPNHFDSEDHIESNTAKGWITAEQAEQGRKIMKETAEQKAASLPEAMIQNIANGRLQKFFKEKTLNEQILALGDGKETVSQYLKRVDPEVKVVAFHRFSLAD
ncbi:MAG: elongation factor Ts [Bacteroidales bacterium]|nr:elongation factor Ts [Bacteroidales bacterium]MBR5907341.1 elongation factor Ts [Bacteroidales bacterium]